MVQKIGGPDSSPYGLAFRTNPDNNYIFVVSGDGHYGIARIAAAGMGIIVSPTFAREISQGNGRNKLKVVCRGTSFEFYANDQRIRSITHTAIPSGGVGLYSEANGVHVRVEYARVWKSQ